jgi:hypothetical protein
MLRKRHIIALLAATAVGLALLVGTVDDVGATCGPKYPNPPSWCPKPSTTTAPPTTAPNTTERPTTTVPVTVPDTTTTSSTVPDSSTTTVPEVTTTTGPPPEVSENPPSITRPPENLELAG